MAVAAPQARAPNVDVTITELKKLFGDRVSTAHAVREQHGKDISFHEAHLDRKSTRLNSSHRT